MESVLSQRAREPAEIIVVDGASTDGTLEVLERYRKRISILISEPDKGVFDALNKGIQAATGDAVAFLGADDRYADEGVLQTVSEVLRNEGVDLCYGDGVYVDESDRVVRYWKGVRHPTFALYLGWAPFHPSVFIKKRVHDAHGLFDTRFQIAADYEMWVRLLVRHKVRAAYVPRVLARMTLGGQSNKALRNIARGFMDKARAWKLNSPGPGFVAVPLTFAWKLPQFILPGRRRCG